MRFRAGLIIGFAAGYYLGAKAGRERYEQIRGFVREVASSEPVQSVVSAAKEATEAPREATRSVIGNGLRSVSEKLRE